MSPLVLFSRLKQIQRFTKGGERSNYSGMEAFRGHDMCTSAARVCAIVRVGALFTTVVFHPGTAPAEDGVSLRLESSAGKIIEARVIRLTEDIVSVLRSDGNGFEIPFSRLAPASVERLNQLKVARPELFLTVPPDQQLAALKSLREGPPYFIWRNDNEPLARGMTGLINVTVNYVCRGEPTPIATKFLVIVGDLKDAVGEAQVMTPSGYTPASSGSFPILHHSSQAKYTGTGPSIISFVDPDTNAAVSNEIVVQVKWD